MQGAVAIQLHLCKGQTEYLALHSMEMSDPLWHFLQTKGTLLFTQSNATGKKISPQTISLNQKSISPYLNQLSR